MPVITFTSPIPFTLYPLTLTPPPSPLPLTRVIATPYFLDFVAEIGVVTTEVFESKRLREGFLRDVREWSRI